MSASSEWAEGACKVSAEDVAAPFRQEIRDAVTKLRADGHSAPKLVGLLANTDPAAKKYAEWTNKAFAADLLEFELRQVEEGELESELEKANKDPQVHGLMIYYPVFGQRPSFHGGSQDEHLRDSMSAFKDAEGLGHFYRRALYNNERFVDEDHAKKCVLPCTPLAVTKALEHLSVYDNRLPGGDRMAGKTVVVVNRSEVVGRPLAAMLANDGATVYSVDVDSMYIFRRGRLEVPEPDFTVEEAVRKSDIVILGVPLKDYRLNVGWVKENAVVINVASFKNIDEQALLSSVKGVRFMGQVGKVTIAMLERNLMRLYQNFIQEVAAGKPGHEVIL